MATNIVPAYRFDMRANLTSLVGGPYPDRLAAREIPGGLRFYFNYEDGQVDSADVDANAAVADPLVLAMLQDVFGKKIEQLTDDDARAFIEKPSDLPLKKAIRADIDEEKKTEACKKGGELRAFLLASVERRRSAYMKSLRAAQGDQPEVRKLAQKTWLGLDGEIVTSGDWAFLRDDGLLTLDARFTIRTTDGTLISAYLFGTADIARAFGGKLNLETYNDWPRTPEPENEKRVPLQGRLRFEVSGPPPEKPEKPAARYVKASRFYWKYLPLARGFFVGVGDVILDKGSKDAGKNTGYAERVELTIHEVTK